MRLSEVLNKFTNTDFLLTVSGLCDELSFGYYEEEKKEAYWKEYGARKVVGMAILLTNEQPELCIHLEGEDDKDKSEFAYFRYYQGEIINMYSALGLKDGYFQNCRNIEFWFKEGCINEDEKRRLYYFNQVQYEILLKV